MQQQTNIEGYACSPQQKHLWHHIEHSGGGDPWRTEMIAAIDGPLDVDALCHALVDVVKQNEILRTTLHQLPGSHTPVQVILDEVTPHIERHALPDRSPEARAAARQSLLCRLSSADPSAEDAARFAVVSFAQDEHALLVSQPALCADVASLEQLLSQVVQSYDEHIRGGANDLGEPLQYADLAQWQIELLEPGDVQTRWTSIGLDRIASARLPHQMGSPPSPSFLRQHVELALPEHVVAAAASSAAAEGLPPSAIFLATWAVQLGRLCGSEQPWLGAVCEGRSYEGLSDALGLFQKTLPVSFRMAPDMPFADLMANAQAEMSDACEWQEYFDPDHQIDSESPWSAPFAFEYQRDPDEIRLDGLTFSVLSRSCCADRFVIKLTCAEHRGQTTARIEFDASLLSRDDVDTIARQYLTLLENASKAPDAALSELNMIGATEMHQLERFSVGAVAAPDDVLVHRMIEEQAMRSSASIAVDVQGTRLTYHELDRRSNQLARYLRKLGVGPEEMVGIYMDRSIEMLVAILGTLKAGGGYVPLPPGYPRERLAFMLEDSGVRVVLTRSQVAKDFPVRRPKAIWMDIDWPTIAREQDTAIEEQAMPENVAYVIYTSGSTGTPKGVRVTHRNLAHSTRARLEHYEDPVTSFLLLPSFAFDSSVAGIFWTLCQGGRIVMPRENFEQNLTALSALMAENWVSHVLCLPSLYALILDHSLPAQIDSLTTVVVAGETCPADLVRKHLAKLPRVTLSNEYGPTEATVWTTAFNCAELGQRERVPIGKPIPGVEAWVLDSEQRLSPIGVAGEIYIGGEGVAEGYLNREELTHERFISDPLSPGSGRRLYRTGDLARYLPNGDLEFLGRNDRQVKVRGYRIELDEVEAALDLHPSVRDAAVTVRDDPDGDRRIVAHITTTGDIPATASELRDFLFEKIPDHMVPATFVHVDAMPVLPNGKVDRSALPVPDAERPRLRSEYVEPRTPLEEVLAGIWSHVLNAEMVGIHDTFFELGGHSLLVMKLVSEIRDTLDVEISLAKVFDHPTVAGLENLILADGSQSARVEEAAERLLRTSSLSEEEALSVLVREFET